jgi:hypothetical protein
MKEHELSSIPKVDLKRWQPHLQRARREGKSVAAYASEQGLSRHTLYAAAKALRETADPQASSQPKTGAFVRVAVPLRTPTHEHRGLGLRAQLGARRAKLAR